VIGGDKIMTEKFDLSEAKVEKVIVHKIGNQFRDEGMQLLN